MKPLTLEEVVAATDGMIDRPAVIGSVTGVCTDSRAVKSGDLFVAIRGERLDGHAYVGQAMNAGAVAAVVSSDFNLDLSTCQACAATGVPPLLIRVDDPILAMGRLAQHYRRSIIGGSVTVVAVTGSNGKTTTKEMILHILSGSWQGRASIKSYNNNIGVPLTLLGVEPSDSFVICEVGTNAPGEIATLARIIEPEIAVVTTIAEAHLEGLGSLEQIAQEKLSLLKYVGPQGCAIVNADPEPLRWALEKDRELRKLKQVTFGQWPQADLRLTDLKVIVVPADPTANALPGVRLEFTVNDRFGYQLNVPGRHNVINALAAIAVARRFNMDHAEIAERLASFTLPPMRLQSEKMGSLTLINDAYNANPSSMAAAVSVLSDTPAQARRVLIMGDMRELGTESHRLHVACAENIARQPIDLVIAVGENAKTMARTIRSASASRIETHAYASTALAKRRFLNHMKPTDTVLIKGSRLLALEQLAVALREWMTTDTAKGKPSTSRRPSSRRRSA